MTTTPRRRAAWPLLATLITLGVLVGLVAPAGAADDDPVGPASQESVIERDSRIVGGTVAAAGAFPSTVSVRYNGGHICGGTLVTPTWVLTAAHCLRDSGWNPSVGQISVRAGSNNLSSGGTVLNAAQLVTHPHWNYNTFQNDIALVRLGTAAPASVPFQPMILQGQQVASGFPVTAAGWGTTSFGGACCPEALRQVTVQQFSNSYCTSNYGPSFTATHMTCAGVPAGGKDTCQGDSGGPLFYRQGSTWVQIGITSWGVECALAGFPGIYTRLSTYTNWVNRQTRKYGGHSDANTFVRQSFLDLHRRQPNSTELNNGQSSLNLNTRTPGRYASDLVQGAAYQQRTGGVARLYSAFFLRNPDTPGLAYWWQQVNTGRSLQRIANIMASSPEFVSRYGSLNDGQYVDLVYQNVLGRAPDASGRAFWLAELSSGRKSRGEMMAGFSESSEYRTANKARIDVIISFFGFVRRVPTAGELATWQPQTNVALTTFLIASSSYYNRFS